MVLNQECGRTQVPLTQPAELSIYWVLTSCKAPWRPEMSKIPSLQQVWWPGFRCGIGGMAAAGMAWKTVSQQVAEAESVEAASWGWGVLVYALCVFFSVSTTLIMVFFYSVHIREIPKGKWTFSAQLESNQLEVHSGDFTKLTLSFFEDGHPLGGLVSGPLHGTKIRGCSSPLYKMA